MPLDTLYKKDSSGRIRIWEIRVEPYEGDSYIIRTRTGLEEGTIMEPAGQIVDTGRQNRSIRDQANSEAQSKWMKKLDEGYKISRAAASTEIVVLPMKAQSFSKAARHIEYPAAGQRKFDGVRCMAMEATGFPSNIALLTRKNKEFAGMNPLRAEIALLNLPPSIVLDGELFSETLTFQRVTGLVRKFPENLTEQDYEDLDQISYRIYDLINLSNPSMPFVGRYRLLQSLLNAVPAARRPRLMITRNVRINNEEDVVRWLGQFEREGYEGLMVRNLQSPYELNKRSKHLQKVKTFIDEEFPIVGYYEATGNDRGTPVWECEAPNGRRFRARPMGTLAERRELWANRDAMIGRPLTVRFFEYTDDGVPRFPVGVVIRDYEGEDTEESDAESFASENNGAKGKRAVIPGIGKVRVIEVPTPEPEYDEEGREIRMCMGCMRRKGFRINPSRGRKNARRVKEDIEEGIYDEGDWAEFTYWCPGTAIRKSSALYAVGERTTPHEWAAWETTPQFDDRMNEEMAGDWDFSAEGEESWRSSIREYFGDEDMIDFYDWMRDNYDDGEEDEMFIESDDPEEWRERIHLYFGDEDMMDFYDWLRDENRAESFNAEAPLADESITAPYELKIYVPSTSDYGEWVGAEEFRNRVEEVQSFLSKLYGGYTSLSGSGGYMSDIYDLIEEPVVVVSTFASNEDYEKTLGSLEDFLRDKQHEWGQEVIGFEFENDYFMYPSFVTSSGKTTESFAAEPEQIKTWYEVKYQEFPTSVLELLLRTDELESALDEAANLLSGNLYRVEVYRTDRFTTSQNVLLNTQLIFTAKYDYWTSSVSDEAELMATISRRFPERRRM